MITVEPQMANRLINSGPVMILSSRLESRINLMAVTWVTWISCNPPLIGVSLTPSCFTHQILRQSGDFVLNIPDASMVTLVHQVGMTSGHQVDKMRVFDVATHWGRTVKALTLSHAIGSLECEINRYEKVGDHGFFIARVLHAEVDEEVWDGHWTAEAGLVHYLGGDRYLTGGQMIRLRIATDYHSLRSLMTQRALEAGDLFDSPGNRERL